LYENETVWHVFLPAFMPFFLFCLCTKQKIFYALSIPIGIFHKTYIFHSEKLFTSLCTPHFSVRNNRFFLFLYLISFVLTKKCHKLYVRLYHKSKLYVGVFAQISLGFKNGFIQF